MQQDRHHATSRAEARVVDAIVEVRADLFLLTALLLAALLLLL